MPFRLLSIDEICCVILQKEEAERKAKEEAERREKEMQERARREEEERIERKKVKFACSA